MAVHTAVGYYKALLALSTVTVRAGAFDISRSDNVAVYWGQQSTIPLSDLCNDDAVDIIMIAFVTAYDGSIGPDSLTWNLAGNCRYDLDQCQTLAPAIQDCQQKGKILTISMGGGDGNDKKVILQSKDQAQTLGNLIYNRFLGGSDPSVQRAFGAGVLDGIDLDLEQSTTEHFDEFIQAVHDAAASNGDTKKYYLTGAPQCAPVPDTHLAVALTTIPFDAIFIQFYNNDCGLDNYSSDDNANRFNYAAWYQWMQANAVNKTTKLFIGAPASPQSGGHYVDIGKLTQIIDAMRTGYPTVFGGVMLWDVYGARANGDFDKQVKKVLTRPSVHAATVGAAAASSSESLPTTSTPPMEWSAEANTMVTPRSRDAQMSSVFSSAGTDATSVMLNDGRRRHLARRLPRAGIVRGL